MFATRFPENLGRLPISGNLPRADLLPQRLQAFEQPAQLNPLVAGREEGKFFNARRQQAARPGEILSPQVVEGDGHLNQSLQKIFLVAGYFQPSLLQFLVAFEEHLPIE